MMWHPSQTWQKRGKPVVPDLRGLVCGAGIRTGYPLDTAACGDSGPCTLTGLSSHSMGLFPRSHREDSRLLIHWMAMGRKQGE